MYKLEKNKIIITDLSDFCIEHILECGQVFTYEKIADKCYKVFSNDKFAVVTEFDTYAEIKTQDVAYFVDYFDLKTQYSDIKNCLKNDENLKNAIKFGYGIRILNQDIIEVIIGFIISANNNIKRIMNTMQKIRQFGENRGEYFCFPSLKVLQTISVEQFKDMGAGYRAEYLVESIKVLAKTNFDDIKKLDNQSLRKWLISLKGIGPKVADCIMLFGFSRCESFPVDTWIEKVYFDIFKQKKTREQMSKDLLLHYGELSGYAQQYLFYYKRSFVQK